MNYKFDNLNDKIPGGQKIHSKPKNYLPRANTAKARGFSTTADDKEGRTFTCVAAYVIAQKSTWSDVEIIDKTESETQAKRDLNHKNMIYQTISRSIACFYHLRVGFFGFSTVQIKSELALPFMRQEYLCDDKAPTSIKFNIFITFLFEHYIALAPFPFVDFLRTVFALLKFLSFIRNKCWSKNSSRTYVNSTRKANQEFNFHEMRIHT